MLKKEQVVEVVKEVLELGSKKEAEAKLSEIDTIVKAVAEKLAVGDKARIGSFLEVEFKHVDAKTARNPKTGEAISVAEKDIYKVKGTKALNKAE